jgi:ribosomal-protein-alanine N-acetyltransferase
VIRPAGAEDLARLAAIDAVASVAPWSARDFTDCLRPASAAAQYAIDVGVDETGIAGFVAFSWLLDEGTILRIAVDPRARRRGLGGRLLAHALQRLRSADVRRCLLEVRISNEAAQRLYRRAGFTTDGVRPAYYVSGQGREDALLMSCSLDGNGDERT